MQTTIQQFIAAARKLQDKTVLNYVIAFHEAAGNPEGVVKRGKNNEIMRDLRRLGLFTLDKQSVSIPGWDPTWRLTDAGRAAIAALSLTPPEGK